MVRTRVVEQQLRRIRVNFQFFGRAELKELPHILFDNEVIEHVVRGRYEGGWAILCATNLRVLLVDKKPFYLTIEDMRYDMIADVEFNHRLMDATVRLGTVNKTLKFTSYNHSNLRQITSYMQKQVMSFRQRQTNPIQQQTTQQQTQPVQLQQTVQQQFTTPVNEIVTDQMIGQSAMQGIASEPPMPLYNTPVIIRRRVSKFY